MKKSFILALSVILIVSSGFATPASSSLKANSQFMKAYKKAENISWETNDKYEKVIFVMNNETIEVFYDLEGDIIGRSKSMAFDKLPKSAIETITTKFQFPDYQLKDCIAFENASKETNYYISFQTKNETIVVEISTRGSVRLFSKY